MQIPPTPTSSPTSVDGPHQSHAVLPSHNLDRNAYPGPTSVGYARAFGSSGVATVDGFLAVTADPGIETPLPRLLQPLQSSPPRFLFVPLPPIGEAVGRLSPPNADFAPRAIAPQRPSTPTPGQHLGLSRAGYVYDLDAAQNPGLPPPDSSLYVTVHQFLPSISYAQGPLHACAVLHPSMTASAPPASADLGTEQVRHGILVCQVCLKVFDDETPAIAHARVHGSPDLYFCGDCRTSFASESERETHWVQSWGCRDWHGSRVKTAAADAFRNWHNDMLKASRSTVD